jgi:hypothetical protein
MLTRLGEALEGWASAGGSALRDPLSLIAAGWSEIAGEDVAKHSRPTRLSDGTLFVTTRSSVWSHQLSLLSEEILAAVKARMPGVALTQLRFRVGRLARPAPARGDMPAIPRLGVSHPPAASAHEAITRFREDVTESGRAKRAAGWKACTQCSALIAPGSKTLCTICENALYGKRAEEAGRLLYEAPWLGYAGTAALVSGLSLEEYEAIRSRLLTAWWQTLSRARAANHTSADGRERSIASSYVILRCKLPPEAIAPATVRNVLGDELHDLIYGTEQNATNVE